MTLSTPIYSLVSLYYESDGYFAMDSEVAAILDAAPVVALATELLNLRRELQVHINTFSSSPLLRVTDTVRLIYRTSNVRSIVYKTITMTYKTSLAKLWYLFWHIENRVHQS